MTVRPVVRGATGVGSAKGRQKIVDLSNAIDNADGHSWGYSMTKRIMNAGISIGWLLSTALLVQACLPDSPVVRGAPQVVSFAAQDRSGMNVTVTPDADGGAPEPVTPLLHFVAVFDRILDPSTLAVTVDGGGINGVPGAITVVAPGNPSTDITYVPNGDAKFTLIYPPGPQIIGQPMPTLPSGSAITVRLDRSLIRSRDGRNTAVLGPDAVDVFTFTTLPFAAAIAVPSPPEVDASVPAGGADDAGTPDADGGVTAIDMDAGVPSPSPLGSADPGFVVKITFNNLPAADVAAHVAVAAFDAAGQPLPAPEYTVVADEADPTALNVAPATEWPAGATVTVTVDAGASDPFAMKLGQPVSASFVVAAAE